MSEGDFPEEPCTGGSGPLSRSALFTPGATSIAGFAFAVFSMLGQGSWSAAITSLFWGSNYSMGSVDRVMVAWGVSSLLMAGLALWCARSTLQVSDVHPRWEGHLARAAVLVALVGALFAVLTIVGGFLH